MFRIGVVLANSESGLLGLITKIGIIFGKAIQTAAKYDFYILLLRKYMQHTMRTERYGVKKHACKITKPGLAISTYA